ncbi:hypothetical protein PR048_031672 [Dryococelus australis]|uniref:Uncharacterized protein n=1 Tax=Dryococelus australis TaxID=614101 RepID=A0ABQ9G8R3_9NEOP|nr:hypothetical protein PR048_031672 [Dryococelus australis]
MKRTKQEPVDKIVAKMKTISLETKIEVIRHSIKTLKKLLTSDALTSIEVRLRNRTPIMIHTE